MEGGVPSAAALRQLGAHAAAPVPPAWHLQLAVTARLEGSDHIIMDDMI